MHVVTKYNIGEMLYHLVSGESGMVSSILIGHGGATEYKITIGLGEFRWASEQELTNEKVII